MKVSAICIPLYFSKFEGHSLKGKKKTSWNLGFSQNTVSPFFTNMLNLQHFFLFAYINDSIKRQTCEVQRRTPNFSIIWLLSVWLQGTLQIKFHMICHPKSTAGPLSSKGNHCLVRHLKADLDMQALEKFLAVLHSLLAVLSYFYRLLKSQQLHYVQRQREQDISSFHMAWDWKQNCDVFKMLFYISDWINFTKRGYKFEKYELKDDPT